MLMTFTGVSCPTSCFRLLDGAGNPDAAFHWWDAAGAWDISVCVPMNGCCGCLLMVDVSFDGYTCGNLAGFANTRFDTSSTCMGSAAKDGTASIWVWRDSGNWRVRAGQAGEWVFDGSAAEADCTSSVTISSSFSTLGQQITLSSPGGCALGGTAHAIATGGSVVITPQYSFC